jgi:hypothetical protein
MNRRNPIAIRLVKLLAVLLLGFSAVPATAGAKLNRGLIIDGFQRFASGALSTVRASADDGEYIYCSANQDGRTTCIAEAPSRNLFVYCVTNNPVFLPSVQMINKSSYLRFEWNDSFECTRIVVANSSKYLP